MRITVEFSASTVMQTWNEMSASSAGYQQLGPRTVTTVTTMLRWLKAMDAEAEAFLEECYAFPGSVNPLRYLIILGENLGLVEYDMFSRGGPRVVPSFTIL